MRISRISLSLMLLLALAGCAGRGGQAPVFGPDTAKVRVAASFYPVYEVVRAVGGDRVDLVNLVPAGTEPHDWEPTPRHLQTLNQAVLFFYSGAGMEAWVDKTLKSLDNKALTVVELSSGLPLITGDGGTDPHVWLDPQNLVLEAKAVRDALSQVDPGGQAAYAANASAFVAKLSALDQEFRAGLAGCRRKDVFTSHAAFAYLTRRYGLQQRAIMGLQPDAEPKPKDLSRIVAEARAQGVTYIFFETLVSDKVAKVVANEMGAGTLVLNPLEGLTEAEAKAGKDYFTIMRQNLANLQTALECDK